VSKRIKRQSCHLFCNRDTFPNNDGKFFFNYLSVSLTFRDRHEWENSDSIQLILRSKILSSSSENWIIHVRGYRHGKRVISNIIQGSVRRASNFSTFYRAQVYILSNKNKKEVINHFITFLHLLCCPDFFATLYLICAAQVCILSRSQRVPPKNF